MKLSRLKQIIKEEVKSLNEASRAQRPDWFPPHPDVPYGEYGHMPESSLNEQPNPSHILPTMQIGGNAPSSPNHVGYYTMLTCPSGYKFEDTWHQYGQENHKVKLCIPITNPLDVNLSAIGPEDPRGVSYRDPQSHKRN